MSATFARIAPRALALLALVFTHALACGPEGEEEGEPELETPTPARFEADASAPAPDTPAPANPPANPLASLEHPEGAETILKGAVEERLEAGSYTYMRISTPGGDPRWLVTMGPGVEPGEVLVAKSVGLRHDFHSRRLGRDFETLHFVSVEPAGS